MLDGKECDLCGAELDPEKGEPIELAISHDEWDEVCVDCAADRPRKGMSRREVLSRRRL